MTVDEAIEEIKDSMHDTQSRRMAIEALQFQQELVRCKDCDLRYQYPQNVFCNRHIGKVHDDGFCFEGKRRDE